MHLFVYKFIYDLYQNYKFKVNDCKCYEFDKAKMYKFLQIQEVNTIHSEL